MHTPVASREASPSSEAQSQKTACEAQECITVTVQDLTVNVNGVGEDFGETIVSVVDLRRIASLFGTTKQSQRVSTCVCELSNQYLLTPLAVHS